jgi:hypothetical protein
MEDNLQTTMAPEGQTSITQPQVGQNTPELQPSEGQSSQQNLQQQTQVEQKPTPQESFAELRQRAEQAERERNEALGYLQQIAYQQQLQQQQQYQQQPQSEPEQVTYDDDDIIEGRHLKAEFSSLKKELQEYKKHNEEFRRMAESTAIENKLRTKYNDFDSVVTYENIQKLRELKPEVAASLHQTQDLYSKAAATYTILKDMGIGRSSTSYSQDQQRAQANINKPKPAESLNATSPLSHASDFAGGNLTEDRKRQIYEQMVANARRR